MLGFLCGLNSFKDQKYNSLKKEAQESGELFVDPEFPANDSSLFYSFEQQQCNGNIEWKRPKEICEDPKLFVSGMCSCDVVQGMLGNCWFVAACSALAQEKELWNKIIPDFKEQEWNSQEENNYAGIFHFRFWQFGEWIDVVIDDFLPTINGQLVYIKSREQNEFWGALLEKAYAKLHGNYESLDGGNLSDALVDFTGGISENIELQSQRFLENDAVRMDLFRSLRRESENHSLMCCAITATSQEEVETRTEVGLVKGHAYSITAVKKIYIGETGLMSLFSEKEKLYMVRMRNPWGAKEWNGPFSDGSDEWAQISQSQRDKIGLTFDEDGEFWMLFDDFCTYFTDISICRVVNTSWFSFSKIWNEVCFSSQWTTGSNDSSTDRAGGCINHKGSFLKNPQYSFDIMDDTDEIMIYLMQKDRRSLRKEGIQHLVIGFYIMKVEQNRRYRLHAIKEKYGSSDYMRTRSVFLRLSLPLGRYVVIATTFDPEETGEFLLRIFTSKNSDARELSEDVPDSSIWPCTSYPCMITIVTVRGASGLEKQDRFGSADPYCVVKCEGERVKGPIAHNTLDPVWNMSAIFYRRNSDSHIKIQVWNRNVVMDTYMGKAVLDAPLSFEPVIHQIELYGRLREKGIKKPGMVIVEIVSSDDLMAF